MDASLRKLLSVASPPLSAQPARLGPMLDALAGHLKESLAELLAARNGFFCFESALRVFPAGAARAGPTLGDWNADGAWRGHYDDLASGLLFFAEDIFGSQFGLDPTGVYRFDPETGAREPIGPDLEAWAELMLTEPEVETGYPLAHEWQRREGPLPITHRLLPKIPFVLGGEYHIRNLYALDALEGMRFRASLALQICELPDGTRVRLQVVE